MAIKLFTAIMLIKNTIHSFTSKIHYIRPLHAKDKVTKLLI